MMNKNILRTLILFALALSLSAKILHKDSGSPHRELQTVTPVATARPWSVVMKDWCKVLFDLAIGLCFCFIGLACFKCFTIYVYAWLCGFTATCILAYVIVGEQYIKHPTPEQGLGALIWFVAAILVGCALIGAVCFLKGFRKHFAGVFVGFSLFQVVFGMLNFLAFSESYPGVWYPIVQLVCCALFCVGGWFMSRKSIDFWIILATSLQGGFLVANALVHCYGNLKVGGNAAYTKPSLMVIILYYVAMIVFMAGGYVWQSMQAKKNPNTKSLVHDDDDVVVVEVEISS